jgi:hypothetical protein
MFVLVDRRLRSELARAILQCKTPGEGGGPLNLCEVRRIKVSKSTR